MDNSNTLVRLRIMAAAARRFAERKFTDVSMSEIARDLGVSRSVIRLHFTTKEELLTALLDSLLRDIEDILMVFAKGFIVPAFERGAIEIKNDRIHFDSSQRADAFRKQVIGHLESVFDYLLAHSHAYSVFFQESLAPGARNGCFEKLLCLFIPNKRNPLLIKNPALPEIPLTPQMQASYMQTCVLPILSYALFKDSLNQLSQHCVEAHKEQVLDDIRANLARHSIGSDIYYLSKP